MNCGQKQKRWLEVDLVQICFIVTVPDSNVILKKVNNKEFSGEKYA